METAAILRSFHGAMGTNIHAQSSITKFAVFQEYNAYLNKTMNTKVLMLDGRLIASKWNRKGSLIPYLKASETTISATSGVDTLEKASKQTLENKNLWKTFPNGFEKLVHQVCDDTDVAELKLKVGDFEMHLKRNMETAKAPTPIVSPTTAPPIPSEPMVESAPAAPAVAPPKSSPVPTSPFANVSSARASKLAALDASGSNAYVLVSSPTVGSFRSGRTVKGKKQPPSCKEGDLIKEGQTIGFLDQFGNELPVKSDVAGEVLKILFKDGEAVGYGDPLVAVLPSFPGINK